MHLMLCKLSLLYCSCECNQDDCCQGSRSKGEYNNIATTYDWISSYSWYIEINICAWCCKSWDPFIAAAKIKMIVTRGRDYKIFMTFTKEYILFCSMFNALLSCTIFYPDLHACTWLPLHHLFVICFHYWQWVPFRSLFSLLVIFYNFHYLCLVHPLWLHLLASSCLLLVHHSSPDPQSI